jgi:hypothetical protein
LLPTGYNRASCGSALDAILHHRPGDTLHMGIEHLTLDDPDHNLFTVTTSPGIASPTNIHHLTRSSTETNKLAINTARSTDLK